MIPIEGCGRLIREGMASFFLDRFSPADGKKRPFFRDPAERLPAAFFAEALFPAMLGYPSLTKAFILFIFRFQRRYWDADNNKRSP